MGAIRRHGPLLQAILSRATGLGRGSTSTAMTSRSIHFTSFSSPRTLANSVSSLASTRVISVLRSDLVGNSAGCESCAVLIALVTASACCFVSPDSVSSRETVRVSKVRVLMGFPSGSPAIQATYAYLLIIMSRPAFAVNVLHPWASGGCISTSPLRARALSTSTCGSTPCPNTRNGKRCCTPPASSSTAPRSPRSSSDSKGNSTSSKSCSATSANPGGTELGDPTDAPWLCYATDAEATSVSKRWVFLRPTLVS